MTVKSLVLNLFITFAASSAASYYTAAGFVEQILTVLFAKNLANQLPVGFHHSLRVNGRKIDLRGFQPEHIDNKKGVPEWHTFFVIYNF